MTVERAVFAFAGFMVLLSVVLTWYVHHYWLWLTVFVGANMFQYAFSGFCPAAIFFRKVAHLKTEAEAARGGMATAAR